MSHPPITAVRRPPAPAADPRPPFPAPEHHPAENSAASRRLGVRGADCTHSYPKDASACSWHSLTPAEAINALRSTPNGLTTQEAVRRLADFGPNTLPRARGDGPAILLWRQINSPLIWVLIGSAACAVAVDPADGVKNGLVILAVVLLNTLIGFVQEFRAGRAIEALIGMTPEFATAIRDGQRVQVPAADLAPGDVVLLQSGDKAPADLRLLEARNLRVEESALTGESVPAEKHPLAVPADAPLGDRHGMAYGGTLVTYGTATGLVVATGARTELGRISALLKEAADLQTPLTRALATIGKYITVAIVLVAVALLVVGTLRLVGLGLPLAVALQDTVIFAIALAVGAIPEGLPAIVTIALAIGVRRMAARRAVIRKLPAVETLGSTSVICSDKTGTLTRNEMTVQALWTPAGEYRLTGVGYAPAGELLGPRGPLPAVPPDVLELVRDAALCSDAALRHADGAWQVSGDPTEGALVVAAEKLGARVDALRRELPRIDTIPFESEHQFMATLHEPGAAGQRIIVKGAPEALLKRCARLAGGLPLDAQRVLDAVESLARRGMRVLAVAARGPDRPLERLTPADVAAGLEFLGLVGMIDPPREEAIQAVRTCRQAGIRVKMITGDHRATAAAIGQQLGLRGDSAVAGAELERMDDAQLARAAAEHDVFARVAPEHKLRLVRALQSQGHVVAMTGDGVNDAPALKQANIGVAMGITGTAVSKEAADIVLTDDNFASIAAAVEEGRRVYDNLIKSLAFVLPTNLGLAFILIAAVIGFPYDPQTRELLLPMLPTQLLWINLVATVALALPLAFEAREPMLMSRPPRDPAAPVLSAFVLTRTVLVALLMALGSIGLFIYEHYVARSSLAVAQTMSVTTVIMFQIFYVLNCRSLRDSLLRIGLWSNPTIYAGIVALLALQLAFVYAPALHAVFGTAPLDALGWAKSIAAGMIVLPVIGLEKWLRQRWGQPALHAA